MAAFRDRYVLLFGGQGSSTIFSDTASTTVESDTRTSSAANILLSRCHAAFLQEIRSLDERSQSQLGIDLDLFAGPLALLKPATQYHSHAIIQATTIYLCQVLHYLAEVEHMNVTFEGFFDQIQETAGFSSGLIPAAVASRSRTLDDFVTTAVEGFRLAFWIACRTFLFGSELEKKQNTGDSAAPEATASLVIRGFSADQVEYRLAQHYATRTADVSLPSSRQLQVSVVTSSNVTSVSGPRADLAVFRSQAVPDLPTTFAHVLGDVRRQAIVFSESSGSAKPILSSLDGTLYDASQAGLSEWLVRHLLVHCVHWDKATSQITLSAREALGQGRIRAIKLLSFGPGSESLFPELQPFEPRVELVDFSPFKPRKSTRSYLESPDSIAIVGMSVNLPRGKGPDELWETLSQGLSAVEEIPETRFKVSDYYSEEPHKPRSMSARHGAFIRDPFTFDNAFFNISPREAMSMDPQQRVLLHAAQEALDDAGYVPDSTPSFQRASMGCYVGVATGDYTDNLPGGVNVISSPDMYLGLDRGHFLSSTGGCKPFDASADGYCRAEGCVLFVLKRLSDAVAEGDRIHGVIRGIEMNQSGNAHSITHPHSPTQIDLFQRLLQKTNVDPGSVGVIEAHGTGTQIESLRAVFGPQHSTRNPLVISSIKGNIGHCEAASGAAGLAKLLLMMRERTIPVQAGFKNVNPKFADLESSGFIIPRSTTAWTHLHKTPRRAVLNNFGAAGSNTSLLLEDSLGGLRDGLQMSSVRNSTPVPKASVTTFVFSGQGGIYQGMGAELIHTSPVFKDTVMTCEGILQELGFPSILSMFRDSETNSVPLNAVDAIIPSQCACIVLEYALARMFMSWGIIPDYVMGHSLGEYAALCISGVLTLETTLRMVATRAKLMVDHCVPDATGMLACNLSLESAESMISETHETSGMNVACSNSPSDCVVGGPLDQLEAFQKEFKARRIKSKLLDVPYAFHSPAMEPMMEPLRELGRSVQFSKPTIPVMSNVHGRFPCGSVMGLEPWSRGVSLEGAVFLEIGPQPTTLPMLRNTFASSSATYLSTLHKGQAAWKSLSSALAELAQRKISVDWRAVNNGSSAKMTSVPGHVLEGSSYLIPYREPFQGASDPQEGEPADTRRESGFPLLPWLNTEASSHSQSVLETTLAVLGPLITGHDVGGSPICPASVFHELALEGAHTALEPLDGQDLVVSNMSFESPLIYSPTRDTDIVTVHITRVGSIAEADFKITSHAVQGDQPTAHCTGHITIKSRSERLHWRRDAALVARQRQYFSGGGNDDVSTFRTKVLYETIFTRVVKYSAEYQSLAYLKVAGSNHEGIGSFKLPSDLIGRNCIADPVFTDTLLHAAGFIANLAVNSDEVSICARVESVEVEYRDIDYDSSFTVYCSLLDMKGMILADATALNAAGEVVAVVRAYAVTKVHCQPIASPGSHIAKHKSNHVPAEEAAAAPTCSNWSHHSLSTGDAPNSPVESVTCGTLLAQGISQTLNGIVMEVGGFSERDMDYGKSLDELGIDSLMQIEIVSKLTRAFPSQAGLDHHALSECDTLRALEARLSSMLQGPVQEPPALPNPGISDSFSSPNSLKVTPSHSSPIADARESLATLHIADGIQVPLCLFHDGSGQISMYSRLQGHDRSIYAFSDPYFGSHERPFHNISHMAKSYISQFSKLDHSPIILSGWSFGGVVAFEAARQLMADGFDVRGLILIDSPSPIDHEPLPNEVISQVIGGNVALKEEFQFNASLLGDYRPTPLLSNSQTRLKTVMLRSEELFDTEILCGVQYEWLSSQVSRDAAVAAWEGLVGERVEVMPIPGNHFEPFSNSNIRKTGAQIWRACQYIVS
ncbi:Orsellinic acid synthase [Apiospora hydei]|uniref:Orsellinic acid synthase n=1 Tax=Apiospora hydei TaxID=1337664 RepID=A0ABR1V657_9PEZI